MPQKNRVAIVGVGYSTVGRNTGLNRRQLTTQAAKAAMDDAGMTPRDIDGVSMMQTMGPELLNVDSQTAGHMLGISPLNWFGNADGYDPAFSYPALLSIAAVAAGFCHTCIAFRTVRQLQSFTTRPPTNLAPGDAQFTAPFGAAHFGAFYMQRHMIEYGTTPEQFGALAITDRYHASLSDNALLRAPLTMEDYLNSRWHYKPLHLLDCDYPCDAGSAVIFTTEARAHDWKQKPVFVESYALSSLTGDMLLVDDYAQTSPFHCAQELWKRTSLKPSDVDCAQLYDGFTIITFQWLEALGFCKPGEAGPFVEAGNTRLRGSLPVNTDGGACNVGRRHGANFCIEAVRQLRGECGVRQVPNAKVSVWTNAVGNFSGAVLLASD